MHNFIKIFTTVFFSAMLSLLFANQVYATELTGEEKEFFQRLVFAEAGLQDEEAQLAVAAIILNRVESPIFPNNIREVAYQKGQFSCVREEKIYILDQEVNMQMIPAKTVNAVNRALAGEDPTEEVLLREALRLGLDPEKYAAGGALYFYNPNACSENALAARANIKLKTRFGSHLVYKQWDK